MDESTPASDAIDESVRPSIGKRAFVGLMVIAGIVAWLGSRTLPAPDRNLRWNGTSVQASDIDTIRVASFNIHGGRGTDRVRDLGRIAKLLEKTDLVGLNEVHNRFLDGKNQSDILGSNLTLASVFAPTETQWWRDHFGNAMLSRYVFESTKQQHLPGTHKNKFRNFVVGHFLLNQRTVSVLVTHIDRTKDRERQLRRAVREFSLLEAPAIMMGDFNTTAQDTVLQELLEQYKATDVLEHSPQCPERIDWILTRGFQVIDAECIPNEASDHPVVRATLRLLPE